MGITPKRWLLKKSKKNNKTHSKDIISKERRMCLDLSLRRKVAALKIS